MNEKTPPKESVRRWKGVVLVALMGGAILAAWMAANTSGSWQVTAVVLSTMMGGGAVSLVASLLFKKDWKVFVSHWKERERLAQTIDKQRLLKELIWSMAYSGLEQFQFSLQNCESPSDANVIFLSESPHHNPEIHEWFTLFISLLQREKMIILEEMRGPESGWDDPEAAEAMRAAVYAPSTVDNPSQIIAENMIKRREAMLTAISKQRHEHPDRLILLTMGQNHIDAEVLEALQNEKIALFVFNGEE